MRNTVYEIIKESCKTHADVTAVRFLKKREIIDKSYQELWEDICRTMSFLKHHTLAGKHIAIVGASSYEWIVAYFAAVFSNSVALPLDAGLPDADLVELMERGDISAVFTDDVKRTAADTWQANATGGQVFALSAYLAEASALGTVTAADLAKMEEERDPDRICTIMFTSGTTGKSKGVMLSQRNLANNVDSVYTDLEAGDSLLSVLPIHHAFCLSMDWMTALSVGVTVCVNDSLMHMMRNIKRFEPKMMLMVPLMIETIAKRLKEIDPSVPKSIVAEQVFGKNLKNISSGGARLDPSYIELFDRFGVKVYQGYGMTECSPVISMNGYRDDRIGSVGKPLANCEVRIKNEEIQVKGSSVMAGYYKMPKETEETFDEGYLCTGDLGRIDEDGFLYITGRRKNLIILSNGENISPEEMEGQLAVNDLIAEIVVVGNGNYLTAHIFPDADEVAKKALSEEDVRTELKQILDEYNKEQPTYKKIIGLVVRDEPFEKSSTKKIKRNLVH